MAEASNLVSLIYDCQQLVREFFPVLSVASAQVYHSVPAFLPDHTSIGEIYHHEFQDTVTILHSTNKYTNWNSCVWTLTGHKADVNAAVFSPNGSYIISASNDHTAQFWDPTHGTHVKTLSAHTDRVTSTAFSLDGAYAITGSLDATIKMWNVLTGQLLHTMVNKSEVICVAISSDGSHIVSGHFDWCVKLWKPWEKHVVPHRDDFIRLGSHDGDITAICLTPDGIYCASAGNDSTICLWQVKTQQLLNRITCKDSIKALAFSHNSTQLVSGSTNSNIYIWDVQTGSRIKKIKGHEAAVNGVSFSPNDAHIVSASADQTIKLWDVIDNGKLSKTFQGHSATVLAASFSYDGQQIVSASADKTIKIWNVFSTHNEQPAKVIEDVILLAVSPDGAYVISVIDNHTMRLWASTDGENLAILQGHSARINSVVFSLNNQFIASGSSDRTLRIWSSDSGSCLQVIQGHHDTIRSLCFLSDNESIVSGAADTTIQLWNTTTKQHVRTFEGHKGLISCVAVSSDDVWLASASYDYTSRIWDLNSGKEMQMFKSLQPTYAVAFSPTNKILATASFGNSVHLVDVLSGSVLQVLQLTSQRQHTRILNNQYHMQFTQDQQFIVVGTQCLKTGLHVLETVHFATHRQEIATQYMEDGWLVGVKEQQRLCWIPQIYRGLLVPTATGAAVGSTAGQFLILSFS